MTEQSSYFRRFGVRALLVAVVLFVVQTMPWLHCVYQWSGRTASLPDKDVPAYTQMCGSAPAVVVPVILSVLAGIGGGIFWDGISEFRASRQQRREEQTMEGERPLNAREVEQMAWQHQTRGGGRVTALGRDQFPVLTAMAALLRIVGWLAVAGGVLLAVFQVAPWFTCVTGGMKPAQPGGFGAASCGVAVLILAPMLGSFAVGFCLIAFGEIIGVFRGIERNTHQLISSVEQAWNQIKLAGGGGQR